MKREFLLTVVEDAAEKKSDFSCELCDSTFRNIRGLRAHKGRVHKANCTPMVQMDGQHKDLENEDSEDNETSGDEEHSCKKCDFICVNDEQTIVNEIVKLQRKNIVKMV